MPITANDLQRTLEPPTWNGRVGRLLSIEEWAPFAERLQAAETLPIHEQIAFARDYLTTVFPKTTREKLVTWKDSTAEQILKRPDLWTILADFFGCQLRAMNGTTLSQMPTNGTVPPENQ